MDKSIIWNEDMDKAYGIKSDFQNEEEFINDVCEEYSKLTGKDCLAGDVETKSCLSTEEGIEAETIVPMDETDVCINTYYITEVEEANY